EMRAALRAAYFLAAAAQRKILVHADRVLLYRLIEARPPRARIVLRLRAEELVSANDAEVLAGGLVRVVLAGKRPLGPAFLRHVILLRRQLGLELLARGVLFHHERTSFAAETMLAQVGTRERPRGRYARGRAASDAAGGRRPAQQAHRPDGALRGSALELDKQVIQALHERGRILERTAFGERGLVEDQQRKLLEPPVVPLALQPLDQRVTGIQLEARRGLGGIVARRLQKLPHPGTDIVVADDEARRGLGQPLAEAHLLHALAKHALHALQKVLLLLARLGLYRLLRAELLQIDRAARDVLERLAAVRVEELHRPLVEPIGQQEHLDVAGLEDLEMRARARGGQRVRLQVVDHVLLGRGRLDVLGKAAGLLVPVGLRAGEAQKLRDAIAIGRVFREPFLEHGAELGPEGAVLLRLVPREPLEHVEHP